tara:strand:+ start:37 stop:462 length:426 start_codon:yes stop_codon:yes gene_type:complete
MGVIKKIKQIFETQTSLLMKKAGTFNEEDLECSIDEDVVDCIELDEDPVYVGVLAPAIAPTDEWFNLPVLTEKGIDYMEQETAIKIQEAQDDFSVEPDDIHERMYEIATKNHDTILNIDPPGGSENFQEGWHSGTGWGQFR